MHGLLNGFWAKRWPTFWDILSHVGPAWPILWDHPAICPWKLRLTLENYIPVFGGMRKAGKASINHPNLWIFWNGFKWERLLNSVAQADWMHSFLKQLSLLKQKWSNRVRLQTWRGKSAEFDHFPPLLSRISHGKTRRCSICAAYLRLAVLVGMLEHQDTRLMFSSLGQFFLLVDFIIATLSRTKPTRRPAM